LFLAKITYYNYESSFIMSYVAAYLVFVCASFTGAERYVDSPVNNAQILSESSKCTVQQRK